MGTPSRVHRQESNVHAQMKRRLASLSEAQAPLAIENAPMRRPHLSRGPQQMLVMVLACGLAVGQASGAGSLRGSGAPQATEVASWFTEARKHRPAMGDRVLIVQGTWKGNIGNITKDFKGKMPFKVSFDGGDFHIFKESDVVRESDVEEKAMQFDAEVGSLTADEVLLWAVQKFPGRVVQFSSFGPSGLVILDELADLGVLAEVPMVTIDSLHLFSETYEFVQNVSNRYPKMKLHTYYPEGFSAGQRFKFDRFNGEDMWTQHFDQYTYLTKVEPTVRALLELDPLVWITGRRRSQGDQRANMRVVEYDEGRLKINPLAAWTSQEVWSYIRKSGVPYNPLHDRGYTSIGDMMNTRPIKKGEAERAGRFQYASNDTEKTTECGMHEHNTKWKAAQAEAKRKKQEFQVPPLPCPACLQLHLETFEQVVLHTQQAVLVEFYSPLCGHCQHFGPIYAEVAEKLKESQYVLLARYDLFENKLPEAAESAGIEVSGYPSIWLVRFDAALGKASVLQCKKNMDHIRASDLLQWIEEQLGDAVDGPSEL